MIRSVSSAVAFGIVAVALVLSGCQDSLVSSSPDTSGPDTSLAGPKTMNKFGFCDSVVEGDQTIQAAVDGASSGDRICVSPGTYEEQVRVDKSVTVRGRTAAISGNPVTIDGWVSLDAEGATLRRVVVTRSESFSTPGSGTPDPFGIRITASNTKVAQNVVRSIRDEVPNGAINGIQAFGDTELSDVEIAYNLVKDVQNADSDGTPVFGVAGIKVQADVSDVVVRGNVVRDLHGLYGWGVVLTTSQSTDGRPSDVRVDYNTLTGINDGSVFDVFGGGNQGRDAAPYPGSAVGIDGNAEADEVTVRFNNLLAPNGAESKDQENTLNATCNWWDARSGPTHEDNPEGEGTWAIERGQAEIDYTPWLVAPSPSHACFGGIHPANDRGAGYGRAGV